MIVHKRQSVEKIRKKFNSLKIFDLTSKSQTQFVQLSPFYPHGDIPVPFSDGYFSKSVEGIWQGLKVFEKSDVDLKKFEIDSMKGIKRNSKKFGKTIGHRKGVNGTSLLNYLDARLKIYLPSYEWVLKNKSHFLIEKLSEASKNYQVVFLDFETNSNLYDLSRPLSHASLVKKYIEDKRLF